jgi:hypothetical protein
VSASLSIKSGSYTVLALVLSKINMSQIWMREKEVEEEEEEEEEKPE